MIEIYSCEISDSSELVIDLSFQIRINHMPYRIDVLFENNINIFHQLSPVTRKKMFSQSYFALIHPYNEKWITHWCSLNYCDCDSAFQKEFRNHLIDASNPLFDADFVHKLIRIFQTFPIEELKHYAFLNIGII